MADFNKAKRTNNGKKWYVINTKNYQVYFWALPILPIVIMIDKLKNWQYNRRTWNDEKAKKVLDKTLLSSRLPSLMICSISAIVYVFKCSAL